ncbi:MAG: EamA family transporter [Verrucomicrobia bacterium]|nr:EamA family transporter [Verrucomicrobiota bacterium]MBV9129711.1 EamA family transporter [Verrucomicrobiota bacterium]MBV9300012.1 EamA family transporter [Verrucomicrobiota bacterium]
MITLTSLALVALSQLALAAGEVCLKHASGSDHKPIPPGPARAAWYGVGIAAMSIWFFVWLHLMRLFELNRLFAFEGVSPLLVACASALFLNEKITVQAWFASFLIAFGITLVAVF